MSNSTLSYNSRRRLSTIAKVAALVAALGAVTVMLERSQLTASPRRSSATVEQSIQATDAVGASSRLVSDETLTGTPREHLPVYFPGQFSLPDGTIDPQPTGF
jgi:hypothetical protein